MSFYTQASLGGRYEFVFRAIRIYVGEIGDSNYAFCLLPS